MYRYKKLILPQTHCTKIDEIHLNIPQVIAVAKICIFCATIFLLFCLDYRERQSKRNEAVSWSFLNFVNSPQNDHIWVAG